MPPHSPNPPVGSLGWLSVTHPGTLGARDPLGNESFSGGCPARCMASSSLGCSGFQGNQIHCRYPAFQSLACRHRF